MRLEGNGYQAIADEMQCSLSTAYALVSQGSQSVLEYNQLDLKGLVLIQGERIEAAIAGIYDAATHGHLESIDRLVRLMERQARLFGLDAKPDATVVPVSPFVFQINFGGESPTPVNPVSPKEIPAEDMLD